MLLVEDNEADSTLICKLLRALGTKDLELDVRVTNNGEAALDYLLQRKTYQGWPQPEAIILDVNLPIRNGFEVLSEMRKHPHLKSVPVFMLTTSNMHEDILKSYSLGAVSFITKPGNLVALEDVIRRFLAVELPRALGKE